jgi:hypothetical protein
MLAFDVSVYRLPPEDPTGNASRDKQLLRGDYEDLIALWTVTAAPGCLGWIDSLVDAGKARQLNGNGYPMLYVGETEAIINALDSEIEITEEIEQKLNTCRNDEALVVTAWDLS